MKTTLGEAFEIIKLIVQDKEKEIEIRQLREKLDNIRKIINDDNQNRL